MPFTSNTAGPAPTLVSFPRRGRIGCYVGLKFELEGYEMPLDSDLIMPKCRCLAWYCPIQVPLQNVRDAFNRIPLPLDFDELVAYVECGRKSAGKDAIGCDFFRDRVVPRSRGAGGVVRALIDALLSDALSFPNPIAEVERGLAIRSVLQGEGPRPTAALLLEMQACAERALKGALALEAVREKYSAARKNGGLARHGEHAHAKNVFVALIRSTNRDELACTHARKVDVMFDSLCQELRSADNSLVRLPVERLKATLVRWLGTDPQVKQALKEVIGVKPRHTKPAPKPSSAKSVERIENHFFKRSMPLPPDGAELPGDLL